MNSEEHFEYVAVKDSEVVSFNILISKKLARKLREPDSEALKTLRTLLPFTLKTLENGYGDGRKAFVMEPIK